MAKTMTGFYPFGALGYKPVKVLAIYERYMMLRRSDATGAMPFIGYLESFRTELALNPHTSQPRMIPKESEQNIDSERLVCTR